MLSVKSYEWHTPRKNVQLIVKSSEWHTPIDNSYPSWGNDSPGYSPAYSPRYDHSYSPNGYSPTSDDRKHDDDDVYRPHSPEYDTHTPLEESPKRRRVNSPYPYLRNPSPIH